MFSFYFCVIIFIIKYLVIALEMNELTRLQLLAFLDVTTRFFFYIYKKSVTRNLVLKPPKIKKHLKLEKTCFLLIRIVFY